MTAFTLGADHAAQLAVWRQVKDQSYIQAYTVRRLLTESAVAARFRSRRCSSAPPPTKPPAARSRAISSAATTTASWTMPRSCAGSRSRSSKPRPPNCAPQWAWTKPVLDPDYGFMAQYGRVRPQPAELPAEIAAEIERIEQRLGELEEVGEDEWTDELMAEAAQLEERRTEIDETIDGLAVYSAKDRARAGCIVTIGDDGEFCLHQGLVERAARRNGADGRRSRSRSRRRRTTMIAVRQRRMRTASRPAPRLSAEQAHAQGMRLQPGAGRRSQGAPAADHPGASGRRISTVAFDLALYALCVDLFGRSATARVRSICGQPKLRRAARSTISPARRRTASSRRRAAALDLDWLPLPPAEGFAALAALPIGRQAAPLRLVHRRLASSRSSRSRTGPIR